MLTNTIFYDNKLKWFHYQVVRGTLKTNKIISKFIPGTLPECTFCSFSTESTLHLLWHCQVTSTFINDVYALFINKWKEIIAIPNMKSFCFGYKSTAMHSPENLLALSAKYLICLCRKILPSLNAFISMV